MSASTRKALGSVGLLAYLTGYVAIAAMVGEHAMAGPIWAQVLFFAVAGVIWVVPLKPLFRWMNQGG